MCNITPAVSHLTLSHCCGNSELAYSASAYLGGNSDRASSHASRENVQINSWSRDEFSSRQRGECSGLRMPHRIMGSTLGQTKISHSFWYIVIPYLNWVRTRIKHFFLRSFVSRSRAHINTSAGWLWRWASEETGCDTLLISWSPRVSRKWPGLGHEICHTLIGPIRGRAPDNGPIRGALASARIIVQSAPDNPVVSCDNPPSQTSQISATWHVTMD